MTSTCTNLKVEPPAVAAAAVLQRSIHEAVGTWPPLCARERIVLQQDQQPTFRLLQWNVSWALPGCSLVLCDALSGGQPDLGGFVCSPPESLHWAGRRWRILEEIMRFDPDVVALCEVDHYDDWVFPMLARLGYRGAFVKKPSSPTLQFGGQEDGCAVLVKASRVELLNAHSFAYALADPADPAADRKICNQVAMLCLLRVRPPPPPPSAATADGADDTDSTAPGAARHFVLATTHLKAEKSAAGEAVRAAQARQLLGEVAKFRSRSAAVLGAGALDEGTGAAASAASAAALPVIVTGDMNAVPHASRDGYEPLCYRELSGGGGACGAAAALGLRSAYPLEGEGAFTTWKIRPKKDGSGGVKETQHTIDYVLYGGEGLAPVARVAMPSGEDLGASRAPSFTYPSDHFSLVVDFHLA